MLNLVVDEETIGGFITKSKDPVIVGRRQARILMAYRFELNELRKNSDNEEHKAVFYQELKRLNKFLNQFRI